MMYMHNMYACDRLKKTFFLIASAAAVTKVPIIADKGVKYEVGNGSASLEERVVLCRKL